MRVRIERQGQRAFAASAGMPEAGGLPFGEPADAGAGTAGVLVCCGGGAAAGVVAGVAAAAGAGFVVSMFKSWLTVTKWYPFVSSVSSVFGIASTVGA